MESLFCPVHFISSPLCWLDVRWIDVESVFILMIKIIFLYLYLHIREKTICILQVFI
jgi:hypothetical protein